MTGIWVSVQSDAPAEVRVIEGVPVLVLAPGVQVAIPSLGEAEALAQAVGYVLQLHRDDRDASRHARHGQWPNGEGAR